jgi:hypothetical protein
MPLREKNESAVQKAMIKWIAEFFKALMFVVSSDAWTVSLNNTNLHVDKHAALDRKMSGVLHAMACYMLTTIATMQIVSRVMYSISKTAQRALAPDGS